MADHMIQVLSRQLYKHKTVIVAVTKDYLQCQLISYFSNKGLVLFGNY